MFPTGVTVVSADHPGGGAPRGMTANAFMPISLRPPLIAICVQRDAHMHEVLERTPRFGIAMLPAWLEREARRFAGLPLSDTEPEPEFVEHAGVPILAGALAWLAAETVECRAIADHSLFLGEVKDLGFEPTSGPALAYYRSAFARMVPAPGRDPLPVDPWGGIEDRWG